MKMIKILLSGLIAVCGVLAAAEDIKCVSHRGEEFSAPEASRIAFEKAVALKGDIIKLDARSTADGVVVLCHDKNLKRVMNWNAEVKDLTWKDICEKGTFVPVNGVENEKMLTLEEALKIVKDAPEFWLDAKDNSEKTLDAAMQILLANNIKREQIMIVGFSRKLIQYAQTKYPDVRRVRHIVLRKLEKGKYKGMYNGNFPPNIYKDPQAVVKALTAEKNKLELYGFNIPAAAFEVGAYSAADIQQLRKNNIWCCAYYVHDARSAEKFSKLNFDAFVTGRIAEVRPFCKRSDNNSK